MKSTIIKEMLAEKSIQDEKWEWAEYDDLYSQEYWEDIIKVHVIRASRFRSPSNYRLSMIRIGALAVAACESFDRKNKEKK